MGEWSAQQQSAETTEKQPPKKRRMSVFLLGYSDTDTDTDEDDGEQSKNNVWTVTKQSPKWTWRGVHCSGGQREKQNMPGWQTLHASTCQPLQPQCLVRGCSHSQDTSSKRRELLRPQIR